MEFLKKHHRALFYISWFTINLIQASATGLFDDEAYYWVYSKFPAWGYFDHPPMIALLIKAGGWLFAGELGVRFFIVLLNTLTIWITEKLLEKKDPFLFYAVCGSIAVAQIGGIIAVPDLPLLFFVALYFLLFKRFMQQMNLVNAALLGLGIALMLYSKYHGVLLVFFTLLSNLKLLTKYQTWVAAGVAVILFIPHIQWQWTHDLPSVQYHLFERNASSYRFSFTTEYLLGQILLAGPLIGWLFIYSAIRHRTLSPTEKAMQWSLAGIYLFFLASTFKGRVEANWTIPAFVPLIALTHHYLAEHLRFRSWIYKTLPFTLLLVLAGRIFMALPLPKASWLSKDEFHGNRDWVNEISTKAENDNVVVLNSYQQPSKYWFYSGKKALGLNTPDYRRNNYNFWPLEMEFMGKPAYVLAAYDEQFRDRFVSPYLKESGAQHVPFYFSFSAIQLKNVQAAAGKDSIQLGFEAVTPASYLKLFQRSPYDTAQVYLTLLNDNVPARYIATGIRVSSILAEKQSFSIQMPAIKNSAQLYKLAVSTVLPGKPSVNSTGFKIR